MDAPLTSMYSAAAFAAALAAEGYSPATVATYRRLVARWLASRQPAAVWLAELQDSTRQAGFVSGHARNAAKALRCYQQHAATALGTTGAPAETIAAIRAPRAHRYRQRHGAALAPAEETALRRHLAADAAPPAVCLAARLMLDLGLRLDEVRALRLSDFAVDAAGAILTIREGKGRRLAAGDAPERLGLPAAIAQAVGAYLLKRTRAARLSPWLLPSPRGPGPWSLRGLRAALDHIGVAIGLPPADEADPGRGLNPHRLRHTLATRLAQSGATVAEIRMVLRHREPGVTARYIHPGPDAVRAVLLRLTVWRAAKENGAPGLLSGAP